ncbi:hypothetical protein Dimus_038037 [Dionaea muscipula]
MCKRETKPNLHKAKIHRLHTANSITKTKVNCVHLHVRNPRAPSDQPSKSRHTFTTLTHPTSMNYPPLSYSCRRVSAGTILSIQNHRANIDVCLREQCN